MTDEQMEAMQDVAIQSYIQGSNVANELNKKKQTMNKNDTTRLYGFTRDWHFPYFCFGKKCFLFKIGFSKKDKKFHKYFGKMTSDEVLHTMVHNHNPITFIGIMKVPQSKMYNLLDN